MGASPPIHAELESATNVPALDRKRKLALLIALYFAQGLPYGFFTLSLPVLMRQAGYSLTVISVLNLLALPWALKFLWAPYLDHRGTPKRWLLFLQVTAVVAALLLAQLDLGRSLTVVLVAAFAFNLIAATQDIVTDGLAVRLLDTKERGLASAVQVGAYRLGMICGGGLLLWIFAKTSWSIMFASMAALLAMTVVPVLLLPESKRSQRSVQTSTAQLAVGWIKRLLAPGMLAFVGLIFCYRFGDQMVTSLFGPFLADYGLNTETIALMKGTVGSTTSLIGALLGGWYVFSVGRRQALLWSGLAQAASFLLYLAAALGSGGVALLWTATIVEGLVGTMATVALFALMMDAADPEHAGTDYTLFASLFVVINSAGAFVAARIADPFGYAPSMAVGIAATAIGCLIVVFTLDRKPLSARIAQAWRR
jgi:MFS family permease